jgi:hypothetical protein
MEGPGDSVAVGIVPIEVSPPPSDISPEQNTGAMTVGGHGILPHVFRRFYHIGIFTTFSFLYYFYGIDLGIRVGFAAPKVLAIAAFLQILVEIIRIRRRFVCFGFRSYEADQVSAQAWGTIGACLVLIAAPQRRPGVAGQTFAERAVIGMPILWTLAIIDPLIGELKAHGVIGSLFRPGRGFSVWQRSIIAIIVTWAIWSSIGAVTGEAIWWLVAVMGPVSVAAEYPKLLFIDDNAMMELVPLAVSLLLSPFFSF